MADSIIRRTYKFRIYPSKAQITKLDNTLDLCRELYNAALQERRDAWKLNRINITRYVQSAQLPEIKQSRPDLNAVYAQVLQDVLKRVDTSFQNFFRRVKSGQKPGFPRFQGKHRYNSFTYPQGGFNLTDNGKLRLSKIGDVKIKLHREVIGKVKTLTISKDSCGKWFVCFSVETKAEPLPKTNEAVGIDVGIESFATLSDGTQIDNFKYYESTQKKLRVAQRRVARRKKGSNRRRKAVAMLRSIHQQIHNQRNDFQHKLSTELIRQYDLIAVEDLNILGMSKGILAKQIHDVSWSSFFQKLKYKAESAGKMLIEVAPHWTSQDCSACGERVKKDLSVRQHICSNCGLSLHRDHNAALNILSLGLSDKGVKYQVADRLPLEAPSFSYGE